MKYPTLLGAVLALALILAACAPAATPAATEPPATIEPTVEATEPPATDAPATDAPATDAATEPPAATDAPATDAPSVPVTGAATVNVSEVGTFGQALVDGEGRSLYLFTNDTQNSGTSSCTGECLVNWPPLFTEGEPVAGAGVDASLLGTIALPDGTTQVTYNGWPLYYYIDDAAAGDATGQGVGGVWFLVTPAGEMIEQ
jgi:predicted lipoprotein with Yx(FWY)xxD motif